ncbi:SDR family oxidoreductase [Snuella sedimenti]|uniref:SDR family oxidoreductase n=1 Tax=Snuella sedimenti TaxID=2798802 RepID=A0A8J7LN52_9FLAO|nr:SDR family oxidoreductase [Snuella sedimenti]MBJ6367438.1 SDR family oxidoreductase [Snuella sedimenti]
MNSLFNIKDQIILVTGACGVLGGSIAEYLLKKEAIVVLLHYKEAPLLTAIEGLKAKGYNVDGFVCNVLEENSLRLVREKIVAKYHRIDVLINAAGGNRPGATIGEDQTVFDLNMDDFKAVTDLNLNGTVIPSIVFGEVMARQKKGVIINYSSMAVDRAITRVAGYSAAKAAMENFTRWMAVEMATKFGDSVRVNAIAPGFFVGNQNRRLLINDDGSYTERGNDIIRNTPMKRFGEANELHGAVHFLCSEASKFITGAVIPVDGGFSVFSGV